MIKHEIRWEYILVICIILGTLPCNAQSVIPMPKEMVMGDCLLYTSGQDNGRYAMPRNIIFSSNVSF